MNTTNKTFRIPTRPRFVIDRTWLLCAALAGVALPIFILGLRAWS